jgi:hypothetical protein
MDNEPFAVVDLAQVAQEQLEDEAFDALLKLRRETFNPEDIGADARRKIFISAYVDTLDGAFREPDERFVRTLMDMAGIEGRRMPRLLEEHTLYIRESMNIFFDKKLLERVGFADRNDIVKVTPAEARPTPPAQESEQTKPVEADIVTTEAELEVYEYVKHRLPFLIARDEDLFRKLDNIYFRDFRGTFAISYKQDRKGRLLNFREGSETKYRLEFPDSGETVATDTLSDIDEKLLAIFMKRVEELG